jgi:hypothetical protein
MFMGVFGSMPDVWAQLKRDRKDPVFVVSVSILAALLVVSGPFGTYVSMGFFERMAFWVPAALIGSALGLMIVELVDVRMGPEKEHRAAIVSALLSAILMSVPLFAAINLLTSTILIDLSGLLETALLIFFSNLGICSLPKVWKGPPSVQPIASSRSETPPETPRLPSFVTRLPAEIQAPVALITGRNHHIDIETDLGSASLFMRFSDAVLQMQTDEGVQVHRSHWVAYRRMRCMEKIGQRYFLVLDGDERVPISKSQVEALRLYLGLPRVERLPNPMAQAAE